MSEHHQACLDILADYGINPREVLHDGVYADGYEKFRRDENGDRIISNEVVTTEFIAWPTGFPVEEFFEHYWVWNRAVV